MTILQLQIILAGLGYYHGRLDGITGQQTIAAVKSFQLDRGLLNDGVVGKKTLRALNNPIHVVAGVPDILSPACVDHVKAWEGLGDGDKKTVQLEHYYDHVGYATAGWGHLLLDESGKAIQRRFVGDPDAERRAVAAMTKFFGRPTLTRDEAKSILSIDLNDFLSKVAPVLQGTDTSQEQLDSLVSFSFNVGVRALSSSTVLVRHKAHVPVNDPIDFAAARAASKAGNTTGGMERAFGAWSNAGGEWALGLFRRRMSEAMLYDGVPVEQCIAQAQVLKTA